MTTVFKTKLINEVGTTPEVALATSSSASTTVIGLSMANLTDSIVLASVLIQQTDGALPTPNITGQAYYIKNVIVPPNQSLRVVNGGERLVIGTSTNLIVSSNTVASLDLVVSYVEIS